MLALDGSVRCPPIQLPKSVRLTRLLRGSKDGAVPSNLGARKHHPVAACKVGKHLLKCATKVSNFDRRCSELGREPDI